MKNYYEQLKKICVEKGTTIYALEKAVGVSNGCFRKWTKSSPTADKLIEISNLLDVSVDYLLGLTNQPNKLNDKANTSTELIKRPKYAVSDKFMEDYMNLLKDKHFSNIAKVYNEFEDAYKIQIYTYIITLAAQAGLNVAKIVE